MQYSRNRLWRVYIAIATFHWRAVTLPHFIDFFKPLSPRVQKNSTVDKQTWRAQTGQTSAWLTTMTWDSPAKTHSIKFALARKLI